MQIISSFKLEEAFYLVIYVWPLRSDLKKYWFKTRGARLACQAFKSVLRLQTNITTQMNTSIVKVSKPIVKATVDSIAMHCTAELIANHFLLEMSIKCHIPSKYSTPSNYSTPLFLALRKILSSTNILLFFISNKAI